MRSHPASHARRAAGRGVVAAIATLCAACAARDAPLTGCTLEAAGVALPDVVRETSGAAWSRTRPGTWWTVNDSGNGPELFAFDAAGTLLSRVRVAGAVNRDWEDIAAGPCGAPGAHGGTGNCLYVADIGDNRAASDSVTVYWVPEPAPGDTVTARAERFSARYPGGPRDAEALFVLPDGSGAVTAYVVSKGRRTPVELFRFPLGPAGTPTGTPELQPVRVLA